MGIVDDILEKTGLKYEELRPDEKETLNVWMQALDKGQLTVDKIKNYIFTMREVVEGELTKTDLNKKQDAFLKARLRNYMLLEAFLTSPEKAREQMERAIAGMASSIKR